MDSSGLHKQCVMCAQKMKITHTKKNFISMMADKNKKKKINVLIIQSAHFYALFPICTIVL